MLKSHCNNTNEKFTLKKKKKKKKDAVTWMRTHILRIDGPLWETLRHGN